MQGADFIPNFSTMGFGYLSDDASFDAVVSHEGFTFLHYFKQFLFVTFSTKEISYIMKVDGYNNGLGELRPGEARRFVQILPDNLHKALIPGERYRLIWPGEEIFMWDWGTKRDWVGKELKSQAARESKLPRLILPASAGVEFTVKEESEPWPGRAEYEAEFGFSAANSREADWLLEQNPPRSPSPISPSQRV